ncbi:MAG TPA: hypothetical protein VF937_10965 [Chloroflexota bacterium]
MLWLFGGVSFAQSQDQPPPAVTQVALETASAQLGVPPDSLVIVMSAQRDWPDSSLGCPQPGFAYFQIVTPGYIVTVDTDDLATEVQVHTDEGSTGVIC